MISFIVIVFCVICIFLLLAFEKDPVLQADKKEMEARMAKERETYRRMSRNKRNK